MPQPSWPVTLDRGEEEFRDDEVTRHLEATVGFWASDTAAGERALRFASEVVARLGEPEWLLEKIPEFLGLRMVRSDG